MTLERSPPERHFKSCPESDIRTKLDILIVATFELE